RDGPNRERSDAKDEHDEPIAWHSAERREGSEHDDRPTKQSEREGTTTTSRQDCEVSRTRDTHDHERRRRGRDGKRGVCTEPTTDGNDDRQKQENARSGRSRKRARRSLELETTRAGDEQGDNRECERTDRAARRGDDLSIVREPLRCSGPC